MIDKDRQIEREKRIYKNVRTLFKITLIFLLCLFTFILTLPYLVNGAYPYSYDIDYNNIYACNLNNTNGYDYEWNVRKQTTFDNNYSGSYSFDDTISYFVNYNNSDNNCYGQIESFKYGHDTVLSMNDESGSGDCRIGNTFNEQISGIIEYWFMTNDASYNTRLFICDDAIFTDNIYFYVDTDKFRYYDGSYHILDDCLDNTWYHLKIEFDCATDWSVSINGVIYDSLGFVGTPTAMNRLLFMSIVADQNYISYFDGIGYDWLSNYTLNNNLVPNHYYSSMYEVDKYEFAIDTYNHKITTGTDNPIGWTDIDPFSDKVNIASDGTNDNVENIVAILTTETYGIERNFNDDNYYQYNVSIQLDYQVADIDTLDGYAYIDIESFDGSQLVRTRCYHESGTNELYYYDGSSYNILDSDYITNNNDFYFNFYINHNDSICYLTTIQDSNKREYIFPLQTLGKDGLSEVEIFFDDNGAGNQNHPVHIDSVGAYREGKSLSHEYAWIQKEIPLSTWSFDEYSMVNLNFYGYCNISATSNSYELGNNIHDFISLPEGYEGFAYMSIYATNRVNIYDESESFNNPYIIYQLKNLVSILGTPTDMSGFRLVNLELFGVQSYIHGIYNTTNFIEFDKATNTELPDNYFYSSNSGDRLYFRLESTNANEEFIQCTFMIPTISCYNRTVLGSYKKIGTPFLYHNAYLTIEYSDYESYSIELDSTSGNFNQLTRETIPIIDFVLLITDNDNNLASGNVITGYITAITMNWYINSGLTITILNLVNVLIPLLIFISPPLIFSIRLGKKVIIPIMIIMSIFMVATDLFPNVIFFSIIICLIYLIYIQSKYRDYDF